MFCVVIYNIKQFWTGPRIWLAEQRSKSARRESPNHSFKGFD